jgi:hypothetical protein
VAGGRDGEHGNSSGDRIRVRGEGAVSANSAPVITLDSLHEVIATLSAPPDFRIGPGAVDIGRKLGIDTPYPFKVDPYLPPGFMTVSDPDTVSVWDLRGAEAVCVTVLPRQPALPIPVEFPWRSGW